jgi:hypothetical protein
LTALFSQKAIVWTIAGQDIANVFLDRFFNRNARRTVPFGRMLEHSCREYSHTHFVGLIGQAQRKPEVGYLISHDTSVAGLPEVRSDPAFGGSLRIDALGHWPFGQAGQKAPVKSSERPWFPVR